MREFKALNPSWLPESFDAESMGEEPIVEIDESDDKIIISYVFPGFYLSDDARNVEGDIVNFKQVNIGKTGFIAESGKPLLPSFGRYVQIPANCKYEFTYIKSNPLQFDDVLILPAQQKLTDSDMDENIFEYDRATYANDEYYPSEVVEISGPYEIDDYSALLVHVRPFQYNPARKKLVGYGNITVSIVLKEDAEKEKEAVYQPETDKEGFGNLFLNPKRNVERRLPGLKRPVVILPKPMGPEFIILYHDDYKDAAEKLAQWKNTRGLRTETAPISSIGTQPDDIKKYIRNKRKIIFSRLRYVLLLGDVGQISSETVGSNITDYYYSTAKDPQNDLVLPWIAIGRIPVQNQQEALDIVEQIITYEKTPPGDGNYYKRMAFGALFQEGKCYMKTMEDVRDHMISLGFDVERIYVSEVPDPMTYCDGSTIPQDVRDSIVDGTMATDMLISSTSEGQLVTGHRDHGGPNGWLHPSFAVQHLDAILSQYSSLFYSINCQTGRFDYTPKDCFAEKILKMKGGAPTLIAATRNSGTFRNNSLLKALFDGTWGGVLPTFPGSTASYPVRYHRIGDILNYAKSYLPVKHSGDILGIKDHFEIYHVIGDPTLELWKAAPRFTKLSARVRNRILDIVLSECPKGSVVTIWSGNKLVKRIEPSSDHISIPLQSLSLPSGGGTLPKRPGLYRGIVVCFWAPGHHFEQALVKL
jgi:hypothetical protein